MRWKLLRRRLSISASRVAVHSRLPWPLRWMVVALVFGFSAAVAAWAFEFGRDIAGLDREARLEVRRLRAEVRQLREQRDKAQVIANTVESLLKTERVAQERLAQQVRQAESEAMSLRADLGFFERLLPAAGDGLSLRGVQVEPVAPGQLRYQLLLMQRGRSAPEFRGAVQLTLAGTLDGQPWTMTSGEPKPLGVKQYARVEGLVDLPAQAVVQTVQVKVSDNRGGVRATQTVHL